MLKLVSKLGHLQARFRAAHLMFKLPNDQEITNTKFSLRKLHVKFTLFCGRNLGFSTQVQPQSRLTDGNVKYNYQTSPWVVINLYRSVLQRLSMLFLIKTGPK